MEMTLQQKNAVYDRSGTLLVSAGAGSGKTSTLTKRIITRISDKNDSAEIDDFLVVTFTNAAAKELSEKIEKALIECVSNDLYNKKAVRQLAKLRNANISTINSFCYSVVKKHFQALGLAPKLRIADESEAKLLKLQVIDSVIENKYNSDGSRMFYNVVELFSGSKSDESLIETLSELYTKIMNFPEPFFWLEKAKSRYDEIAVCDDFLTTEYGKLLKSELCSEIKKAIVSIDEVIIKIRNDDQISKYCESYEKDIDNLKLLLACADKACYDALYDSLSKLKKTPLKAVKDVDEEYKARITGVRDDSFKKIFSIVDGGFCCHQEQIKNASKDCSRVIDEIISILKEIDTAYNHEKNTRGIIDFSDAERLTYKLFVKETESDTGDIVRSDIALEYAEKFKEIYIDEYQDINPIQDIIFRSICRYHDGVESNRFMVGDVKQSIYRFRGARPDLFTGYLNCFSKLSEDLSDDNGAHKEYLSNNFRCSKNVVEFTNYIFKKIMSDTYSKDEELVYSKKEVQQVTAPCELILFESQQNEENEYYEDEIVVVAEKILQMVNNPEVLNSDGKQYGFGDVAVLLRSPKGVAEKYARYFELCGIPTYSELTENFFENSEILLMLCILNSIDNPFRDIYLTGAMRSEIFAFSDDDLVNLRRLNKKITYSDRNMWQSVNDIADSSIEDGQLIEKCKRFVKTINDLRKTAIGMPSDRLLLEIYSRLHIINTVSGSSFNSYSELSALRRENLMILYDLARQFEHSSFRGLSAFIDFLNDKMSDPNSVSSAKSSGETGSVRIMSIHRSKGLEFPICIIAGLSHKFSTNDEKKNILVSDSLGIAFKLKDLEGFDSCDSSTGLVTYDTPFRSAVRISEKRLAREEEKRILYVGMTRARDRLIMTMKEPTESQRSKALRLSLRTDCGASEAGALCDYIYPCVVGVKNLPMVTVSHVLAGSSFANISNAHDSSSPVLSADKVVMYKKALKEKLSITSSDREVSAIPSKITVSSLKYGLVDEDGTERLSHGKKHFQKPAFADEEYEKTAAKKGIAMHLFMQFAEFKNALSDVYAEAKRLLEKGFITGEQYELLDYESLKKFFDSELYKRINLSKNVYRERRFALKLGFSEVLSGQSFSEQDKDDFVLLQGVIDLFFENTDGSFTVVDFKTDKIKNINSFIENHSEQLKYYKTAVEQMTGKSVSELLLYSFNLDKIIGLK